MPADASPRALTLLLLGALACAGEAGDASDVRLGDPLPELTDAERGRFLLGRALFERLATAEEGLGPLYNAERCSDCHDQPVGGGGGHAIRVLKATRFAAGRCDLLRASGGDNLQQRVTPLAESLGIGPETVPEGADTVSVIAPPLFGLGLVEAIPDAVLAGLADPDDEDGDGVSGRLPVLADGRTARFGRKGDAADLAGFVDTALRFELGLTTPAHPLEEGPNGAPLPAGADPVSEPEIDERGVGLLVDYLRYLAPPARERPPDAAAGELVRTGAEVFERVGCVACHLPALRTGSEAPAALRDRDVALYSDLLLHDLGRGVVCGADASPGELRTAPLWGLRHRTRLLHDGSAATPLQAISAHGGEAAAALAAFLSLGDEDRAALLRFLASL